jgi:hypothetical protein
MKKKFPVICFLLTTFLWVGCSSLGIGTKNSTEADASNEINGILHLSYDDGFGNVLKQDMDVYSGTWDREIFYGSNKFVTHAICLSNFYLSGSYVNKNSNKPYQQKKYEVCFTINDKIGTTRDSPISPGKYSVNFADTMKATEQPDLLIGVKIGIDSNKYDNRIDTRSAKGFVNIISSTKNTIDAEFDISDGKNAVNGKFHLLTR